jgi:hypothetical protein
VGALRRSQGLGDDEWAAIKDAEDRLLRAKAAADAPLVLGSAKDLCEAIAKVVIAERGNVQGSGADIPELVTVAHKLLEFQPGEGLATDPETRKVAQGLKSIVLGVGELRNRHGTGHGRSAPSGVADEHGELAFDAALLWSAWALRRLEPYIAGGVTALVRDLDGQVFHSGELAQRLTYANLPRLLPEDQMRLGVAVARRASADTFVVRQDGIEAVDSGDVGKWPLGYVEGLVGGLFLDQNGYLDLKPWKVREAARLLAAMPDPLPLVGRLSVEATNAGLSYGLVSDPALRQETVDELTNAAGMLPEGEGRESLLRILRQVQSVDPPNGG